MLQQPALLVSRALLHWSVMTAQPSPREEALRHELARRILVLDGAMGTLMQGRCREEGDFRGERFRDHPRDLKGDHEMLNLTRPEVILAAHREYLAAGADIIETNTFNANRISQADYGTEDLAHEMNVSAARWARQAADEWMKEDPAREVWVAGALGPTNKTASLSRDVSDPGARSITFDELEAAYHEQAAGLLEGGEDLLVVESVFDSLK